jgi:hypothetical protein
MFPPTARLLRAFFLLYIRGASPRPFCPLFIYWEQIVYCKEFKKDGAWRNAAEEEKTREGAKSLAKTLCLRRRASGEVK